MEKDGLNLKEAEEIKDLIDPKEKIEKRVALGWDGSNLTVRLPRELSSYLELTKENRFKKSILFRIQEKDDGSIERTFEVIDRDKPRRKNVKKKTTNKK